MKKVLSVILAVVIGLTASVNAFAASAKKTYISDIVAVTAKDENDAKSQLEKEGYKLLTDSNVNSSLKTGVYIGYKETDNAEEALTDIAAMNMKGNYSYSDYKTMLQKRNDIISSSMNNIMVSISKFQDGYKDGTEAAKLTYNTINMYTEDDSKQLMGDYLLKFDFSDEAKENLTKVFMQGNSQIVLAILDALSISADDADSTLVDRMVDTGTDGVADKYNTAYPTVAKAVKAMNAAYGKDAQKIYDSWDAVHKLLADVEENLAADDGYDTEIKEEAEIDGMNKESAEFIESAAEFAGNLESAYTTAEAMLYDNLKNTDFEDGTLLDFFMQDKDDISVSDLYFIVDSMTDAQRAQIETVGLAQMLVCAFAGTEDGDSETKECIDSYNELVDSFEAISVYQGVDRSIFTDGVAFTSAATEHEALYGESWFDSKNMTLNLSNEDYIKVMMYTSIATGFFGMLFLGMSVAPNICRSLMKSARDLCQDAIDKSRFVSKLESQTLGYQKQFDKYAGRIRNCGNVMRSAKTTVYQAIRWASFVFLVIGLILDITFIVQYFTVPDITEEVIPHHMVTAVDTPEGEDYAYYQTVKDLKGNAVDLNNHEGDKDIGWLVLYTTKEETAGDPILAENLRVQTGSANFREGVSFIHLFNEAAALNLTSEKYKGTADKANGTYIVFDRDASILIGSAVTNGMTAVIGIGGLAVGAVLGAIIARLAGKKKKETPAEA